MAAMITAKLNGGHGNRFQPIARQERSTLFIRSRLTSEIPNSANVATTKAAVRTAWSALRMDTTSNMCLSAFAPTYYSVFFAIRSFSIPTAVSFRRESHSFGGRAPAPCNEHFSDYKSQREHQKDVPELPSVAPFAHRPLQRVKIAIEGKQPDASRRQARGEVLNFGRCSQRGVGLTWIGVKCYGMSQLASFGINQPHESRSQDIISGERHPAAPKRPFLGRYELGAPRGDGDNHRLTTAVGKADGEGASEDSVGCRLDISGGEIKHRAVYERNEEPAYSELCPVGIKGRRKKERRSIAGANLLQKRPAV